MADRKGEVGLWYSVVRPSQMPDKIGENKNPRSGKEVTGWYILVASHNCQVETFQFDIGML